MDYREVLDFLYSQLPMYQRVGKAAYKHDLGKTLELDRKFGYPHRRFKTIHIAGTNGKGSVAHTLASVLQEAGYRVGLYTSPHYLDFRERIKINGQKIEKDYVVNFVQENMNYFKQVKPSFFEMTVAMAFKYFADRAVDIAVIEVGMGGRLDSTNVITPLVSVITNIGFDHMQFLGDTLTKIAAEKAGIIKPKVPVVIGEMPTYVRSVFLTRAQELDSPIYLANLLYQVNNLSFTPDNKLIFDVYRSGSLFYQDLRFGLSGLYQRQNVPVILQTLEVLQRREGLNISESEIYRGFGNVVENTGIMGRWQILSRQPLVVVDAGHNEDGVKAVMSQVKSQKYKTLHIVFGMVNDKSPDRILRLLPQDAKYYFTRASVERAMAPEVLEQSAAAYRLNGGIFSDVPAAVNKALKNAKKDDMIFIGGSTFVVADALAAVERGEIVFDN